MRYASRQERQCPVRAMLAVSSMLVLASWKSALRSCKLTAAHLGSNSNLRRSQRHKMKTVIVPSCKGHLVTLWGIGSRGPFSVIGALSVERSSYIYYVYK